MYPIDFSHRWGTWPDFPRGAQNLRPHWLPNWREPCSARPLRASAGCHSIGGRVMASKRRVAGWALTCTPGRALAPQLPNRVALLVSRGEDFQGSSRESLGPRSITCGNTWKKANEIAVATRAKADEPVEGPDTNGYIENRSPSVSLGERCQETRDCSQLGADRTPRRVVGAGPR